MPAEINKTEINKIEPRKIVFMGTPEFAAIILKDLIAKRNVALVVTQPDKPIGRKQILTPPPVKIAACKSGASVLQPIKLDEIAENIEMIKPCAIVVAAYGQILSDRVLKIAPCFNLHASLLPKYRGASPIQASILSGDRLSGITLMRMREGLDTGEMLGFAPIDAAGKNAAEMTIALAKLGAKLFLSAFAKFDSLFAIEQNDAESSLVKKVKKDDGAIDFDLEAIVIERMYRAYSDRRGIVLKNNIRLSDVSIDVSIADIPLTGKKNGEIIAIDKKTKAINIACSKGAVTIGKVTPSGKNEMGAADYLNGKRLSIGDIFA